MIEAVAPVAAAVAAASAAASLAHGRDRSVLSRLPERADPVTSSDLRGPTTPRPGVRLRAAIAPGRRDRLRLRRADAEIPLLLDGLTSAATAGIGPHRALRLAADTLDGPLGAALRRAVHDVDLGARWRDRLRALTEEFPLPDLARTVTVLTRTESLGSSFADAVGTLAQRVRASRRAMLSQRARTAPVKMLFPLVFLVLPAFLLLTVVPLLVATLDSIR